MKTKISPFWKTFSAFDKISLISQFYDGCENQTDSVYIIVLDSKEAQEYVENKPHIFGVKDIKTTKDLANSQVLKFINDKETLQLEKHLQMQIFHVGINWNKLHEMAGQYHDLEAKEPYGVIQQEKIMRKLIWEKSEKLNTNKFGLTEKDLGFYIAEPINEDDYSYDNSLDCHIQFITTLIRMEKNGFIKILDFDFNFDAERTLIEEVLDEEDHSYPIANHIYCPAEHCHVEIELIKTKNQVEKFSENDKTTIKLSMPITLNWLLTEYEFYSYLLYKNKLFFTFQQLKKNP